MTDWTDITIDAGMIPVTEEMLPDPPNFMDYVAEAMGFRPPRLGPMHGPPAPPVHGPTLPTFGDVARWALTQLDAVADPNLRDALVVACEAADEHERCDW